MKGPKKIAIIVVAGLFVYLSMYTWNLRTGHLDGLSSYTGLDVSGFILRPGIWASDKVVGFWDRYVYLMDLKQKNDDLVRSLSELKRENMLLSAQARSAERLDRLLGFVAPEQWESSGARVIAHRMGPAGVLDTAVIDKGSTSGVEEDMPVVALDGVVGRVLNTGAVTASVLMVTDANSRIAVIGESNRSPGMLTGKGYGEPLELRFVNLNADIEPGELLLSSGLSDIFPKGMPVAKVIKVQRSDISLFLTILAEPLVDVAGLEEVLLLKRLPVESPDEAVIAEEIEGAEEGQSSGSDE